MDLETKKSLQDILQAAREIEEYTAGLGFDGFKATEWFGPPLRGSSKSSAKR